MLAELGLGHIHSLPKTPERKEIWRKERPNTPPHSFEPAEPNTTRPQLGVGSRSKFYQLLLHPVAAPIPGHVAALVAWPSWPWPSPVLALPGGIGARTDRWADAPAPTVWKWSCDIFVSYVTYLESSLTVNAEAPSLPSRGGWTCRGKQPPVVVRLDGLGIGAGVAPEEVNFMVPAAVWASHVVVVVESDEVGVADDSSSLPWQWVDAD